VVDVAEGIIHLRALPGPVEDHLDLVIGHRS
jgi:hypothetical protein